MNCMRRLTINLLKRNTINYFLQSQEKRFIKRWVYPTLLKLTHRKEKMDPQLPVKRSSFFEWNHKAELYSFGKRLHEEFDENLLLIAFTNKSYIVQEEEKQKELGVENPHLGLTSNDHLSLIGKSLLQEYIPAYVKRAWPSFPQIGIDNLSEFLLSEETLSHISLNLGTKDIILSSDFPATNSTLAKTFEAIIGALQESSGKERASLFIRDFVLTQITEGVDLNKFIPVSDPIAEATAILGSEPEARLIGSAGVNTLEAVYQVGLYVDKKFVGSGFGDSVMEAKEMAARDVLNKQWGTDERRRKPFPLLSDVSV